MLEINKVYNESCISENPGEGANRIEDGSVDLVFCDLPFGETQNYWDQIIPFDRLWSIINRVKKPNTAVCLFSKGKFVGQLMCSNLGSYRYKIVCKKRQPKGWQNAKKMPMKAHEDVLVFYDEVPEDVLVFYDKLPIYNPQKTTGHKRKTATVKKENAGSNYNANVREYHYDSTERYPLDVIEFAWDTYPIHPTQKPIELCEWFIKTYTDEGMTVLDLTTGYGSIPYAARKLNRNFIAFDNGKCEKKGEHFGRYWADLANERIEQINNNIK
jgi:DNA modification methylase